MNERYQCGSREGFISSTVLKSKASLSYQETIFQAGTSLSQPPNADPVQVAPASQENKQADGP